MAHCLVRQQAAPGPRDWPMNNSLTSSADCRRGVVEVQGRAGGHACKWRPSLTRTTSDTYDSNSPCGESQSCGMSSSAALPAVHRTSPNQ